MKYELISNDGRIVAAGRKQGFCLMDSARISGDAPGPFDCDNQGISPGREDVYDRSLDCQWIDVTEIPPGEYQLRLTVNPDLAFDEARFDNNQTRIPVAA